MVFRAERLPLMQYIRPVVDKLHESTKSCARKVYCQPGLWSGFGQAPVCDLELFFDNNVHRAGTGWIMGPDTVVTTAENLFPTDIGDWPRAGIRVSLPGPEGRLTTCARNVAVLPGWQETNHIRANLGCIKLTDQQFGYSARWFSYGVAKGPDREICDSSGVPLARTSLKNRTLSLIDSPHRAEPGAPLLINDTYATPMVVAMVTGSKAASLNALVINDRLFDTLCNWASFQAS